MSALHLHCRAEAKDMFMFAFQNYLEHAFPKVGPSASACWHMRHVQQADAECMCVQDDLRPLSCTGSESQGGIALTLIDALDTLLLVGEPHVLRLSAAWLGSNLSLHVDKRVHVFELTIRAVGG